MPGLLTAEGEPTGLHGFEDVAVTDSCFHHPYPLTLHRPPEPEVGHDGGDDGVLIERSGLPHAQREHGEDLVTVDHGASRVDSETAIRVAVMGDADIRVVGPDRLLQPSD